MSVVDTPSAPSVERAAVVAPAPVPEPASLLLLGTGCLSVGTMVRRRAARG